MSPWVATIVVIAVGATAILNISMRDGEVPATSPLSIEEFLEREQTEQAVEAAYSRILPMLGTFQE